MTNKTEDNKEVVKPDYASDVAAILGEGATEELKAQTLTLFETAVEAAAERRVQAVITEKTAELEAKNEENFNTIVEEFNENADRFMTHVAEEWIKENKVAIESAIRVERAESLLEGLLELVSAHNLEIPENGDSVVEELSNKVAELTAKLNKATVALAEANDKIEYIEIKDIVEKASVGMTEVDKVKFHGLAEEIKYKDVEDFTKKLDVFKVKFFSEAKESVKQTELTEDNKVEIKEEVALAPEMKRYVDFLTGKKSA